MTRLRALVQRLGRRDLAKDTIWGFAYEGALLVSTTLSFAMLGRSLGEEGFGHYASLYAIAAPLITLASVGVALAQAEHVVRLHEDLESTTRSCFALGLVSGIILIFVGTAIALLIVDGLSIVAIVSILALEFVTYPLVLLAANTIQVRDGYAAATPLRIIPLGCRIVILFVLYITDTLTVASLGVTYLATTALLGLFLIRYTGRRFGISMLPGRIHRRHFKSSMTYSFGVSGFALQNDGDKFVLAAYNSSNVGLYAAAYRIVQFGMLPVNTFTSVTHNRFLEHDDADRGQHLRRTIRFGGVCALYGLVFMIGAMICAPLITILVGDEFEGSIEIVRWLAPLVFLRALAIFPMNGLMGLGHARLRTGLLMATAVLSLAMYAAFIPLWDWKGAVAGTLIGEAVLAMSGWYFLITLERRHDAHGSARAAEPMTSEPIASGAS